MSVVVWGVVVVVVVEETDVVESVVVGERVDVLTGG